MNTSCLITIGLALFIGMSDGLKCRDCIDYKIEGNNDWKAAPRVSGDEYPACNDTSSLVVCGDNCGNEGNAECDTCYMNTATIQSSSFKDQFGINLSVKTATLQYKGCVNKAEMETNMKVDTTTDACEQIKNSLPGEDFDLTECKVELCATDDCNNQFSDSGKAASDKADSDKAASDGLKCRDCMDYKIEGSDDWKAIPRDSGEEYPPCNDTSSLVACGDTCGFGEKGCASCYMFEMTMQSSGFKYQFGVDLSVKNATVQIKKCGNKAEMEKDIKVDTTNSCERLENMMDMKDLTNCKVEFCATDDCNNQFSASGKAAGSWILSVGLLTVVWVM